MDAAKEAEIQRQKELIGEMPFKRIVEKIKKQQSQQKLINNDENLKENQGPSDNENFVDGINGDGEKQKETNSGESESDENGDNASEVSINGSSPETLPRNDIPDITQNGSADSSDAAGSPVSTPLNPEIETTANNNNDDILRTTDISQTDRNINILNEEEKYQSSNTELEEADDELSSNDGNSFDTVKHYPMGKQSNVEIDYGSTMKALETLQKSQENLKRKAEEEEAEKLRAQQTYILPSVLSYNYTKEKKSESDSDSDAELFFASDPCRQCDTIRKDPKMKTKVCTLM
uniref:Uncharacterized protein n=1 Tax=Panagrolaimus sp. PS1159 TaxID=55785 RepID=A0AC35EV78_9BILA